MFGKKKILRKEECKKKKAPESIEDMMNAYDKDSRKIYLLSMLLMDPGILILFVYYFSGVELNILITYLVLDILIYKLWKKREDKLLKEEQEEMDGEKIKILRQKIAELQEIDENNQ